MNNIFKSLKKLPKGTYSHDFIMIADKEYEILLCKQVTEKSVNYCYEVPENYLILLMHREVELFIAKNTFYRGILDVSG